MSGIQKLSNMIFKNYTHFQSADRDTVRFMRDATFDNFFNGRTSGLNTISGDIADGISNRNPSFKDKQFFDTNGYYSNATSIWIA